MLLALNKEYSVADVTNPKLRKSLTISIISEHSLTVERGGYRQTWVLKEERLCIHCAQQEVVNELHF